VVSMHLAMAYEANQQPDKARETLSRVIALLDEQQKVARERGVANHPEPPWAAEARAMLERLSAAPAAPAAPPEG